MEELRGSCSEYVLIGEHCETVSSEVMQAREITAV